MRTLIVTLMLAGPLALAQEKKDGEWKERTPKGAKFAVELPGDPEEIKKESTDKDKTVITMYLYKEADDKAYMVAYNKLPGHLKGAEAEAALKAGYEQARTNLKGAGGESARFLKSVDKTFEKFPKGAEASGYYFEFNVPDPKSFYRAKLLIVGDELYQIVVMGPEKWTKDTQAGDRFMQSFHPTK